MSLTTGNLEVLTLPRLRVFVTLAQEKVVRRAASALGISEQAVRKNIAQLEQAFDAGEFFVVDAEGKLRLTDFGTLAHRSAVQMLQLGRTMATLSQNHRPETTVAFLPHHADFVAGMVAKVDKTSPDFKLQVEVLGEQHRSVDAFQDEVIGSLLAGVYDLVIGPPPLVENDSLRSIPLYTARLVAMVPQHHPSDSITIDDLTKLQLLLPPDSTRAGARIRAELLTVLVSEHEVESRIRLTGHGTKVLTIFGKENLGVVVVPSDIAHSFAENGPFYGHPLEPYRWVEVVDNKRKQNTFTHDVYATCRHVTWARAEKGVRQIALSLTEAIAARLGNDTLIDVTPYTPDDEI